ncbi:FtsK/SpoIIIE domain-containing protein [Priestia aryabhattai]|uniref:FtsK/SpoIIIE domain-containing protein n=1 Tax=Priestia aryabhattai TaxID=412384 RepID=UPI003D276BB1
MEWLQNRWSKMKWRGKLMKCFKDGGIVKTVKHGQHKNEYYPTIQDIHIDKARVRFVFTLKNGMNPELVLNNMWLFKQTFGEHIELSGKYKKFTLSVYSKGIPTKINYNYRDIESHMNEALVPIVTGFDNLNVLNVLDLKELHHIMLTGSTGAGKSSLFRSMICSLIFNKAPHEIQFIMSDLKNSEFGIFRNIPHVKCIHMEQKPLLAELRAVETEMKRRSKLMDQYDVECLSELEEKLPIIMIIIDEVFLLTDNDKIMKILTNISCLGRSASIHLILAMQRSAAKELGGQLLNNMNGRISGKQSNEVNAKIAGLKSSKDITIPGRMALSINGKEKFIQVPFLDKK